MTRQLLTIAMAVGCAGTAAAQVPPVTPATPGVPQYGSNPATVDPYSFGPTNPYNRTSQTLSPYLNLLRGGNPAVNYAYGVRPGTMGRGGSGGGAPMMAAGAQRGPYFPQQQLMPQDPLTLPTPGAGYVLPPAGHPVLFNNTLGYFPGGAGQRGPQRAAMAGAGGPRR